MCCVLNARCKQEVDVRLKRIKYISRFAPSLSDADLDAIVSESQRNNEALGLSGVLVTSAGLFMQVLEGPPEAVEPVYDAIVRDPRHSHILLLSVEENIEARMFPNWFMRRLQLDEGTDERLEPLRVILETIIEQRALADRMTRTLERGIWRELSHSNPSGHRPSAQ